MAEIIEHEGRRFERTGEVRTPREGEMFMASHGIPVLAAFTPLQEVPREILREIPSEFAMSKPETGHTSFRLPLQTKEAERNSVFDDDDIWVIETDSSEQAAEIVEAVNSHAALMEAALALKRMTNAVDGGIYRPEQDDWNNAEAALAELEKAGIKL